MLDSGCTYLEPTCPKREDPRHAPTIRYDAKKYFRLGMAYTLQNLYLISFCHIRPIGYGKP